MTNWFESNHDAASPFGAEYDAEYGPPLDRTADEVLQLATELQDRYPRSRVLDLACGTGRIVLPLLAETDNDFIAIDINRSMLDQVRERMTPDTIGRLALVQGDMREIPLKDEAVDVVALYFSSFGYFNDAQNLHTLKEMHRVLKPGGIALIDNGNLDPLLDGSISFRSKRSHTRRKDGELQEVAYSSELVGMNAALPVDLHDYYFAQTPASELSSPIYLWQKRIVDGTELTPMIVRAYHSSDYHVLGNAAGYVESHLLDEHFAPFDSHAARRLIVRMQKQ